MHKLFRASHAYLSAKTLSPFSRLFHGRADTPVGELQTRSKLAGDRPEPVSAEALRLRVSHPWPEWVELMECLLSRGYFGADENPLRNGDLGRKEANLIRTACLNFSRDRFDIIRFLSKKNIRVIAGCGCPSLDRKVVNSGKRLRAHVGIDEGDTCSSCNLRGDCDRAFVTPREDEGGRTVDVMRILVTYGLDPVAGTVENKPFFNEAVKESVKVLLKEMVANSKRALESNLPKSRTLEIVAPVKEYSSSQEKGHSNDLAKHGDWQCPKCNFLNFAKNVKCLRCNVFNEEKLKQLKEDQEHLPLKKGDWICNKCNFLNFARNTRCMLCKENPPRRHLNPGEWECPSCNYINFRRNMACLKCDYRRPKTANSSDTSSEKHLTNASYQDNRSSRADGGENADVNTRLYAQQQDQNHGAFTQRSAICEHEDQGYRNPRDEASDFVDFPIFGGKSDLSRDTEKIESWKSEMLERSKGTVKVINDDVFESHSVPRRLDFPNLSDDEDVAEWFGPKDMARAK